MSKEYEIRTMADLAAIPQDKIDACLTDLGAWLRFYHSIPAEVRPYVEMKLDTFNWLDDGEAGIGGLRIEVKK